MPETLPATIRDIAAREFLEEGDLQALVTKHQVPFETLETWAREDNWLEKRQKKVAELVVNAKMTRDQIIAANEPGLVRKQLKIADKIQQGVEAHLQEEEAPDMRTLGAAARIIKDVGDALSHVVSGPKQEMDVNLKPPFLAPRRHPGKPAIDAEFKEIKNESDMRPVPS